MMVTASALIADLIYEDQKDPFYLKIRLRVHHEYGLETFSIDNEFWNIRIL